MDLNETSSLALERNITIMGLSAMVASFGATLWLFLLPIYLTRLGATPVDIALIFTANLVLVAIGSMPAGALADWLGRKFIAVLASCCIAIATFSLAFVTTFFWAGVCFAFDGLGTALFSVRTAIISESVATNKRGAAFGKFFTLAGVPAIFGPLVGGQIVSLGDFRYLFTIAASLAALSAALMFTFLRETRQSEASLPEHSPIEYLKGIKSTLSNRTFLAILLSYSMYNLLLTQSSFVVPLYAQQVIGMNTGQIGIMFALVLGATTVISIPGGKLADRYGRRKIILASWIGEILLVYGFVFSKNVFLAWTFAGLWAASGALDGPALGAWLADITKRRTRGATIGMFLTTSSLVTIPFIAVSGFLYAIAPEFPFYANSVAGVIALTMLLKLTTGRSSPLEQNLK